MSYTKVFFTVFSLLLMPFLLPIAYSQASTLNIKITNIELNKGKVIVEIYKNESNWLKEPFRKIVLPSGSESQVASFEVPYGDYAVSVYQDINESGELDRRIFGIPKEPVGFGNNYRPFGEPKFDSALIEHRATLNPEAIKLFEVF